MVLPRLRSRWRRSARIPTVLCTLALLHAAEPMPEYRVKAAFLINFPKFVEWPDSQFADPAAPISICIIGDDPFGRTLDRMVEGETVNARRLVVVKIKSEPPKTCQVVFIPKTDKDVAQILSGLRPGVLTVGEGESFLQQGGMIAFVVENRRVRFDINQSAASNGAVKMSSKLLNVARAVER